MNEEIVREALRICLAYKVMVESLSNPLLVSYYAVAYESINSIPDRFKRYTLTYKSIEAIYLLEKERVLSINPLFQDGRFPKDYASKKIKYKKDPNSELESLDDYYDYPEGEMMPQGLISIRFIDSNLDKWIETHTNINKESDESDNINDTGWIKEVPKDWCWIDEAKKKFQFGKQNKPISFSGARGEIFVTIINLFIDNSKKIIGKDVKDIIGKSLYRKYGSEIGYINRKLRKIEIELKGSKGKKGFYYFRRCNNNNKPQ